MKFLIAGKITEYLEGKEIEAETLSKAIEKYEEFAMNGELASNNSDLDVYEEKVIVENGCTRIERV